MNFEKTKYQLNLFWKEGYVKTTSLLFIIEYLVDCLEEVEKRLHFLEEKLEKK